MNHTYQVLIKFLYVTFILYIILGVIYDVDYSSILFVSITLTLIGYAGDLLLLPRIGNLFTTLSDTVLSYLIVWFIGTYFFDIDIGLQNYKANHVPLFQISLAVSLVYSVVEWFYHRWFFKILGKKEVLDR